MVLFIAVQHFVFNMVELFILGLSVLILKNFVKLIQDSFLFDSTLQYSLFGSILTFGAMIGAITSGKIADYIGRKGVSLTRF